MTTPNNPVNGMRDIGKPWRSTTNDAAFAYETFANNPY